MKEYLQIPSLEVYPKIIKNVKLKKARSGIILFNYEVEPLENLIPTIFSKKPIHYFFKKPKNNSNYDNEEIVRRIVTNDENDSLKDFQ